MTGMKITLKWEGMSLFGVIFSCGLLQKLRDLSWKPNCTYAALELSRYIGLSCLEKGKLTRRRFTLRDQGQTIAIGKITKLITDPAAA